MKKEDIARAAQAEVAEEKFQEKVKAYKKYLKRPWYKRLFPWKITFKIERIKPCL